MFCEFAIIGTTASGKSDLAIELAKEINGVILSLDSLCVYKEIDIASAKPSLVNLNSIKHFGINLIYPNEHFCVGDFFTEYKKAKDYAVKYDLPLIITGGSGFYLKAMLNGLIPKIPSAKVELDNEEIWQLVLKLDPDFATKFSKNDTFRMSKWYQIYKATNEIPSIYLKKNTKEPIIKKLDIFELTRQKDEIKSRIQARTKSMLKFGLLDEAKCLFDKYSNDAKPLKCIGLKECQYFFSGAITSKEALYELICTHTIQLAKRQQTFNKSQFLSKKILGKNPKDEILKSLK